MPKFSSPREAAAAECLRLDMAEIAGQFDAMAESLRKAAVVLSMTKRPVESTGTSAPRRSPGEFKRAIDRLSAETDERAAFLLNRTDPRLRPPGR